MRILIYLDHKCIMSVLTRETTEVWSKLGCLQGPETLNLAAKNDRLWISR